MMIGFLIVIILIALAIYGCYRYRGPLAKFLRSNRWGANFLSWYHSVIFDFKMENPDRVPKQITWGFVAVVIVIGVIAILVAGVNQ